MVNDTEDGLYPLAANEKISRAIDAKIRTITCGGKIIIPPPTHHKISDSLQISSRFATGAVILAAMGLALWVRMNQKSSVVQLAQPTFLYLMLFGCALTTSSVMFLTIQPDYDSKLKQLVFSSTLVHPNTACVAAFWSYSLGFALTFTSLFAKMIRIRRLFSLPNVRGRVGLPDETTYIDAKTDANEARRLRAMAQSRHKKVTARDVLWIVVISVVVELAILLPFQIKEPLTWHLMTNYSTPDETGARCTSPFLFALVSSVLSVHLAALLVGNWLCYTCRHIPTKFAEVRWISYCLFSWFQTTALSIPVMQLLTKQPENQFVLLFAVVMIQSLSLLCFVFGPKVYYLYRQKQRGGNPLRTPDNGDYFEASLLQPEGEYPERTTMLTHEGRLLGMAHRPSGKWDDS
eukprot:c19772_g1_i4.p1 GENE.c19772_g1_i4~~c19772_g1_i4.p1  ORF type:complete len:405 (+),score=79.92 c19772_g1_i4:288-1502(+)